MELSARGEQGYEIDGNIESQDQNYSCVEEKWVKNTVREEETPVEKYRGRGEGKAHKSCVVYMWIY